MNTCIGVEYRAVVELGSGEDLPRDGKDVRNDEVLVDTKEKDAQLVFQRGEAAHLCQVTVLYAAITATVREQEEYPGQLDKNNNEVNVGDAPQHGQRNCARVNCFFVRACAQRNEFSRAYARGNQ